MNVRKLVSLIYRKTNNDHHAEVEVSFYSSGRTHQRPITAEDLDVVDGKLVIRVEDN